jgi:hypothetical protein
VEGVLLYGKFLKYALVDDVPKPTSLTTDGSSSVVMTLPHFWSYAVIDPGMLLLFFIIMHVSHYYQLCRFLSDYKS